eukprot:g9553.t1
MNSKYGIKNREYTTSTLATILRWLNDAAQLQTTNSCTNLQEEGEEFPTVPDEEVLVEDLTQGMAQLSTAPEQPSTGDGEEEPIDFGS